MKRLFPLILMMIILCGCGQTACTHENAPDVPCLEVTCPDCGTTFPSASDHTESPASCTEDVFCTVCEQMLRGASGHQPGQKPTCTDGQLCTVCGETLANALEHVPSGERSCMEDVTCTVCGEVLLAAAHEAGPEAACLDDQLCLRCGTVLQNAYGHALPSEAEPCTVCGLSPVLEENPVETAYLHETLPGIHYHNTLDAYYSGAVLICGDYALEYFTMREGTASQWAGAVNGFAARFPELNVSAMLVPKSCAYHAPSGYDDVLENQEAFIRDTYALLDSSVTAVDAMTLLTAHRDEYLYYRTDHHWTSLGAYYASAAYCRANGIVPRPISSYEAVVQPGYVGTLYSFCPTKQPILKENPDYTVYHLPEAEYSMTYDNGGGPVSGSMLYTDTVYYASGFICGDNALTVIETDNETGRNLLVFKESYGNCFVPFMADYYDTVVVVDIRSYEGSIAALVQDYALTDALIINNIQASTSLSSQLSGTLSR